MIRELCDDLLLAVGAVFPTAATMLGTPAVGRTEIELPVLALEVVSLDELTEPKPAPRLGENPRPGTTLAVTLHLFANDESELLDLLDNLKTARTTVVQVGVWSVRYGPTERYNDGGDNPYLQFAMMTPVSLSTTTV